MKYRDREGNTIVNETSQDKLLQFLYNTLPGRAVLKVMTKPCVSQLIGKALNLSVSTLMIDSFIKKNGIRMADYIPCRYSSYNDFFTRRIKPSKRPINNSEDVLISPSDGKVTAYRISPDSLLRIKNSRYTVKSLLRDEALAEEFNGGVCVIIRLTVDNYHRYCYVDSGNKSDNCYIPGVLHTVNPVAMEYYKIYAENSREYTVIDSDNFGRLIQMEVGALAVGRISNHHGSGRITKGSEKGYFEFGGSTIVLLFREGCVELDSDIWDNTAEDCETIVKMGERIGRSIKE